MGNVNGAEEGKKRGNQRGIPTERQVEGRDEEGRKGRGCDRKEAEVK